MKPISLEQKLYTEGYAFDFFQAMRVLQKLRPEARNVGGPGPVTAETVRFRSHVALSFPASSIFEVTKPVATSSAPVLTQTFFGLVGTSGILPRHYTEMLLRIERESRGAEKYALRDWLDLFNHRLVSQFYRAWEKYRFTSAYERQEYLNDEPDPFTLAMYSIVGVGFQPLRKRLTVVATTIVDGEETESVLAKIEDLSLVHYAGILSHRPRSALLLGSLLRDYFQLPIDVEQFRGQWLPLSVENQTSLGQLDGNSELGVSAIAGSSVWDVQSRIRIRIGPVHYTRFREFLPDPTPSADRKAFFLLLRLTRLYIGPELDFDVQLLLHSQGVPHCRLTDDERDGPRLGWNTWLRGETFGRVADDAVFDATHLEPMRFSTAAVP